MVSKGLVGSFTTQAEALEAVSKHRPCLLYATEDLEQGYGISLIAEVQEKYPDTQCVLFLKRETESVVNEALKAGADGIVLISSLGKGIQGDFFKSIKQISEGGTYYPQEIRVVVSNPPCLLPELSERETETLVAPVEGLSNQLISE